MARYLLFSSVFMALLAMAVPAVPQTVPVEPGLPIPQQVSADGVSSLTFTAPRKQLYSVTVKIGATSGYVLLLDAAALPANGAVDSKWCWPVNSDGTKGGVAARWAHPIPLSVGATVAFSTTGCDSLTASATAKIMGQAL